MLFVVVAVGILVVLLGGAVLFLWCSDSGKAETQKEEDGNESSAKEEQRKRTGVSPLLRLKY